AFVFPEITAASNETVVLCTNNLTGEAAVRAVVGMLDVAESTRFLPTTTPVSASIDQQKGGCFVLLPAVQPNPNGLTPPVMTGIPAMFVTGANENTAGKGLVSSLQLVGADGSVKLITSPTLLSNVLVPAVQ